MFASTSIFTDCKDSSSSEWVKTALESNLIRGAALDVYTKEPCKENILFGVPNIILTPHIAASTNEAQVNVAKQIADQISNYFNKNLIINAV